jgi:hypothetical protein
MHGRGPGHRTCGTDFCVWETASSAKTRQGASRQEREYSFLSAAFETADSNEASDDVIAITDCAGAVLLGRCVEGSDVRTAGVSFNGVRVDLGECR